ncbi:hypothetical protein VMT65_09565 [Nocardia sp. CDC153]|uniref:hypothetical protein n=1 Tax=Nocardia sp. CDC153 TaxID=3112167 RepID=UPI002DBDE5F0|nr:hypothetical protein [Nocardia sp. CDC153]MEC3953275.1 hypothetical protein [Nocardia sp. CDC153]
MTELPHQHAPEIPVTCRDKNVEQSTPGSGWKVLRRIAIAACLLLVVALGDAGRLSSSGFAAKCEPRVLVRPNRGHIDFSGIGDCGVGGGYLAVEQHPCTG